MERRDQVLRLQAQLEARRRELTQIQQRIHKAEVCRHSQTSGGKECSQHRKQEASNDQAQSTSTGNSQTASQELVRSLMDPHSPLWLSGQHYPAQYLIRHTRSMSRVQRGVVTMPKLPPSTAVAVEDFDLPDDDAFYPMKEQRLRESPPCSRLIGCQLVKEHGPPVRLKCTHHIQCSPGEVQVQVPHRERSDGKLIVKEDGSFAVLFPDSLTLCHGPSTNDCYSHSLSKSVMCFDYLTTEKGALLIAVSHLGEITVLVQSEGRLEHLSLPVPANQDAWPKDFICHYLTLSELPTGPVLIAAYCCRDVCVWSVCVELCQCEVASSFSIPHLCSLFLLHDRLLATTTDYRLIICSCVLADPPSSLQMREVPLSCCPCSGDSLQQPLPLILAATYINSCLLVVLTLESSGGPHLGDAAWIIALRENDHLPYLLHTYHTTHTTSNLILRSYTGMNKLWTLVGVADRKQLLVWRGTEAGLPSATVSLEGEYVSDVAWDTLSNTCLVLDKSQQVHYFQNTTS